MAPARVLGDSFGPTQTSGLEACSLFAICVSTTHNEKERRRESIHSLHQIVSPKFFVVRKHKKMEKDAAFKALYPCGIKKNSVKETVQDDEVPQRMYGRR